MGSLLQLLDETMAMARFHLSEEGLPEDAKQIWHSVQIVPLGDCQRCTFVRRHKGQLNPAWGFKEARDFFSV